jgi:hypothetical protein
LTARVTFSWVTWSFSSWAWEMKLRAARRVGGFDLLLGDGELGFAEEELVFELAELLLGLAVATGGAVRGRGRSRGGSLTTGAWR